MNKILWLICFIVWTIAFIGWIVALVKTEKHNKPIPMAYSIVMIVGSIGMIIALHI